MLFLLEWNSRSSRGPRARSAGRRVTRRASGSASRSISAPTAISPMSRMGCRTVVSVGRTWRPVAMSSNPVTATSVGTRSLWRRSTPRPPIAISSLPKTMARGGVRRPARSSSTARAPPTSVNPPYASGVPGGVIPAWERALVKPTNRSFESGERRGPATKVRSRMPWVPTRCSVTARTPPRLSAPTKSSRCGARWVAISTTGTRWEISASSCAVRLPASTARPSTLPTSDRASWRPSRPRVDAIRIASSPEVAARSAPRMTWST